MDELGTEAIEILSHEDWISEANRGSRKTNDFILAGKVIEQAFRDLGYKLFGHGEEVRFVEMRGVKSLGYEGDGEEIFEWFLSDSLESCSFLYWVDMLYSGTRGEEKFIKKCRQVVMEMRK